MPSIYSLGNFTTKQFKFASETIPTQFNEISVNNQQKIVNISTKNNRTAITFEDGTAKVTSSGKGLVSIPGSDTLVIKDVQLGDQHIVILTKQGQIFTYGGNEHGQLGYKTNKEQTASPEYGTVHYSDKPKQVKPSQFRTDQKLKKQKKQKLLLANRRRQQP